MNKFDDNCLNELRDKLFKERKIIFLLSDVSTNLFIDDIFLVKPEFCFFISVLKFSPVFFAD